MKPPPLLELITRQGAESSRPWMWQGMATSAAVHVLAVAVVVVVSLWNRGDVVDPVTPYPPEQDYASIEIAPSQAAHPDEQVQGAVQFAPEAASPIDDNPQPAATLIERPLTPTLLSAAPAAAEPPAADRAAAEAAAPVPIPRAAVEVEPHDQEGELLESLAAMGSLSRASSGVDSRLTPRVLINPAPQYPRDALAQRRSGVVVLQVSVDAGGAVIDLHVVRSSGVTSLDQSALEAVRRWRFLPARDPQTGPRKVNIPVEFILREAR